MDTQTIVILAVAVNIAVAVVAIVVPWFRDRRARAAGPPRASAAGRAYASNGGSNAAAAAANPAGTVTITAAPIADGPAPATTSFPDRAPASGVSGMGSKGSGGFAIDTATGLDLGAAWARWLAEEEARIQRFQRPATIVLVELAGLDRLAERLGPDAAERLIPPIATTLRRDARATDHLARVGPTRFAALLTETTEVQAIHYVERVRSACDLWLEAGAVSLRLSLGWAEIGPDRSADVAVLNAERRLFAERERARRELAGSDDEPPIEMPRLQPSASQVRSAQA
jgi:diguanylate cyclase (GGDEF)-like protein